ncbi:MAG: transcription antitermination factor NusB [Polyangiaceae bacterium]
MKITARTVAAAVLLRVEQNRAFAAAALESELAQAVQLEPRDRALATEIVYGALRTHGFLEAQIARFSSRPVSDIDPKVRVHLVVAAYQMFFLTRVPRFAAVNDAVDAVRDTGNAKGSGFANAILRKVAAAAETEPITVADAMLQSAPAWLRDALTRALGSEEAARDFIAESSGPADVGICVYDATTRDAWVERLSAAKPDASFRASALSPHAIRAKNAGRPQDLEGFLTGELSIQEEGSQLVAQSLGAKAGETVLDACAGRGNKTAILAHAVGPGGAVDAVDQHPKKLERLAIELERVHVQARNVLAVDWTVGAGDVPVGAYDRVLVDAPCSGTGTIRKRPEIFVRRVESDLKSLADLQLAILERASAAVRPGGTLVYAVCSVLREECEDVIAKFERNRPEFRACPFEDGPVKTLAGERTSLRLLPTEHGTEGYFMASFSRLVEKGREP